MGVSTNIHIGPYLVAEGKKIVDVDELVNTCCNEKCVNYISNKEVKSKFCASCGSSANTPKKFTVATEVQANDYLSSICSDDLCYTDPMGGTGGIFISNKRSPYDLKFDEYEEEIDLYSIVTGKQIGRAHV